LLLRDRYFPRNGKGFQFLTLLLLIVFSFISLLGCNFQNKSDLYGTVLNNHGGSKFSLFDENNLEVTDQTHIGQVHLITFLFANCTSLCPLVTSSIKQSLEKSEDTRNTPVLIITVDPKGDTIESRIAFKNRWGLSSNWHYLSGNEKELGIIWKNFYLNPQESAMESLSSKMDRKYDIVHSSPVYILNGEGRPAVVHTNPIDPDHLHKDLIQISNR
jgi:cytochrome oxidase Cu insertion factor (SCO1/SenC/PrrC family)